MDRQEFAERTQLIRQELGNDELFAEVEREARQDERVITVANQIKELRVARCTTEADALVEVNRDVIYAVRQDLLLQHGVEVDIRGIEQKLDTQREEKLKIIHEGLTGDESDSELLSAFYLTNEEGQLSDESLNSPLFRERTKMAFEAYRSSVTAFEALVDYNKMYGVPTSGVGRADAMRRDAHNSVSQEVAEDLGLEFSVARRLVAKIRDGIVPGSGEEDTYSKSILRIGKRLSRRYGSDVAEAVEQTLKPVLDLDNSTEKVR